MTQSAKELLEKLRKANSRTEIASLDKQLREALSMPKTAETKPSITILPKLLQNLEEKRLRSYTPLMIKLHTLPRGRVYKLLMRYVRGAVSSLRKMAALFKQRDTRYR